MDESIRLDRRSFEALAGNTRVKILKSLLRRRKTLTELSQELGLSPSTLKEHLEVVSNAELVVQVDEGRKWKYYELTRKGRQIAEPHELRVMIILGLSIIAVGASMLNLLAALQAPEMPLMLGAGAMDGQDAGPVRMETGYEESAPMAAAAVPGEDFGAGEIEADMKAIPEETSYAAPGPKPVPFFQVGIAAASVLILTWALFYARGEGVI
ncbi:MAG TPA: winged helix-turn-helix domain-containing protein [Candidatus Bilamarchaeaceae archaeon]|nr:winged helix-turn-helix domain-containing protein [Candidatus Bilamarchaeaceae archaeon]